MVSRRVEKNQHGLFDEHVSRTKSPRLVDNLEINGNQVTILGQRHIPRQRVNTPVSEHHLQPVLRPIPREFNRHAIFAIWKAVEVDIRHIEAHDVHLTVIGRCPTRR